MSMPLLVLREAGVRHTKQCKMLLIASQGIGTKYTEEMEYGRGLTQVSEQKRMIGCANCL